MNATMKAAMKKSMKAAMKATMKATVKAAMKLAMPTAKKWHTNKVNYKEYLRLARSPNNADQDAFWELARAWMTPLRKRRKKAEKKQQKADRRNARAQHYGASGS